MRDHSGGAASDERPVIEVSGAGKMYRLFESRTDNLVEALGLLRVMPSRRHRIREFWALRGVSLSLRRGERIGIIGRNGAGKSTLLKAIAGNLPLTEGTVRVDGRVQALFEAGAGFIPDFTGEENVRASLEMRGLSRTEITEALEEVEEFCELGDFFRQPFKAYSAGMQARLAFATATSIRPDILIVDEILGAGDAYFSVKSAERMRALVRAGSSILLVTHALAEVQRYCDTCYWLERGRVVAAGPTLEVITAYEEFVHGLDERRLRSRNRRLRGGSTADAADVEDAVTAALVVAGERAEWVVTDCELVSGEVRLDHVRIGDVQDTNPAFAAHVVDAADAFSAPEVDDDGTPCRRLASGTGAAATGYVVFRTPVTGLGAAVSLRVRGRVTSGAAQMVVSINGKEVARTDVAASPDPSWTELAFGAPDPRRPSTSTRQSGTPSVHSDGADHEHRDGASGASVEDGMRAPHTPTLTLGRRRLSRWSGDRSVVIEAVTCRDRGGAERAILRHGAPCEIVLELRAAQAVSCRLVPSVTLHRADGVFICHFFGEPKGVELSEGEAMVHVISIDSLVLADGEYLLSASVFRDLVSVDTREDLVARAYAFMVTGTDDRQTGAVVLVPYTWRSTTP